MPELPITGGCLCGGVRYEVSEPFADASYCHCTRCQRRSGTAASPNARLVAGSLAIVSGQDLLRRYDPPDGAAKLFCGECGSALFAQMRGADAPGAVRLGTVDGDPGIRPTHRKFVDYACLWEDIPDDGLPRFAENTPPS